MRYFLARRVRVVALVATLAILLPLAGRADEGFWPFNRVPRAAIKQAYGVDLTDAWIERVQQASVRFPSGSGSFVSPDGLVLTNHHVAMDIIQELSTAERDYVKNGFIARDRSQELKAPDLELIVLQSIEDVTARVNAAVKPGMPPAEMLAARRTAIAEIEKDAEAKSGLQSEMVTLYQGAQYHLYLYKKFTDVRLVFAPEFDIAFFGGDPDNFTFPRFCLDMTLFRVYENGKPVTVKHYLPWSTAGVKDGEPVFTSGHPGTTQRLNTVQHLEFLRDHSLPANIDIYTQVRNALEAYGKRGGEEERQAKDLFFSLENSLKSWRGQLRGLKDPALMTKKQAAEKSLRAAVMANADYRQRFGDAWDAVAKGRRDLLPYNIERVMFEGGLGLYSEYFTHARTLVRWSSESQKPNGERLPEYTDTRKPAIERQIASETPMYPGLEQAKLVVGLTLMRDRLGDHPLAKQILAGKTPQARAAELVGETKLADPAFRKQLFAGGAAAVNASTDPFVVLARLIEPRALELRKRYDNEVLAVERDAYAKIAQAVFATAGESAYPDATFTLRLSYGAVKGFVNENGQKITPFTQLRGLYARADQHGMKPPYKYPERWAKARSTLDLNTPYNFVTTNDIVGGNSGSPVINARGELVGLIFDGNIQSLPGYFIYDGAVNRSVAVDVRGMLEAMRKVYQAEALVSELTAAMATASVQ